MSRQIYYRCKRCHKLTSSSEEKIDTERVKNKLCLSCFVREKYNKELKDYLEYLYFEKDLSIDNIAEQLEVTQNAIRKLFKRLDIKAKDIKDVRRTEKHKKIHLESLAMGYKVERLSKEILIQEGFKIINEPHPGFFLQEKNMTNLNGHSYDYLCEKDGKYFIIDIKHKSISQNRTKNYLYVTKPEIDTFNFYEGNEKIVVKILVVIANNNLLLYKFFNWNEFIIPEGLSQGKYGNTVRIRVKRGINLSEFKALRLSKSIQ